MNDKDRRLNDNLGIHEVKFAEPTTTLSCVNTARGLCATLTVTLIRFYSVVNFVLSLAEEVRYWCMLNYGAKYLTDSIELNLRFTLIC